ncbi:site-specific DNA-methyltransferase [Saccharibacter floricola]|uniref:Methyltransferase n=1 Tax=Saccharibacter floricola DSM 15669 TaxID=1123227 RepID=A0ABQ0NX89_9PROT|nr:site-specific DNA-methyltransferase [Saccharibacter floricola]GBQ05649.1 DNA methyltransferase [Saccharibacter floricola DSM 15669]
MTAEMPINRILRGECVEVMKDLPDGSVDCVFADPPYNLQLRGELRRPDETVVDGVNDAWDKFADYKTYDDFTRQWLSEARRVLHKDGTLWVIGSYHNIFRIGAILQDLGYWILNDIVWRKSNPMPNFRGRRFTNAHETLIWAARSPQSKYRFNYQVMKALNDDLQMRSDWYLPLCTGNERLRNDHGVKLHPTQKPESLLHRALLAATTVDDVVLDPFCGTGTTPAVAKRLGRRYLAIERHPDYVKAAEQRLEETQRLPADQLEVTPAKREMPRIPFGSFVESGTLPPGTVLHDRQRRLKATVAPDGTLVSGKHRGSIHKLGALLTQAASCNGWTFWYFERDQKWIPLDTLRQESYALRQTA